MPAEQSRNRPLKVGVQLPEVERVAPWSDLARMATTAEALGYRLDLGRRPLDLSRRRQSAAWPVGSVDGDGGPGGDYRARRDRSAGGLHLIPQSGDDRQEGGNAGGGVRGPSHPGTGSWVE